MMTRYMVALLLLAAPSVALAQPASNWNWDNASAGTKAICNRLGPPRPPARDRPTPAQAQALKGCDSEKLYYGEGARRDPEKARLCAFLESEAKDGTVFSGDVILMQLYANGLGVARNPDLATAYACRIDSAPFEFDGRVAHLQSLKTRPGPFDYCDDITSGLAQGYCQARESGRAALGRDDKLRNLAARLPSTARPLYAAMKKSFDAFVEAHGSGEVDLSGTARAALVIAEQDAVRDQLLTDLGRLATGRWPSASAAEAKAADATLNARYRAALVHLAGKDNFTTVRPEDVRTAQRLWLAYRDAYVRLAAAVPGATRDAVLARLTRLRTAQLDALIGE